MCALPRGRSLYKFVSSTPGHPRHTAVRALNERLLREGVAAGSLLDHLLLSDDAEATIAGMYTVQACNRACACASCLVPRASCSAPCLAVPASALPAPHRDGRFCAAASQSVYLVPGEQWSDRNSSRAAAGGRTPPTHWSAEVIARPREEFIACATWHLLRCDAVSTKEQLQVPPHASSTPCPHRNAHDPTRPTEMLTRPRAHAPTLFQHGLMPQLSYHAPEAIDAAAVLPFVNTHATARACDEGSGCIAVPQQRLSAAALDVVRRNADMSADSRLHSLAERLAKARLRHVLDTAAATGADGGADAGTDGDGRDVCRVPLTAAEASLLRAGPPHWCATSIHPRFQPPRDAVDARPETRPRGRTKTGPGIKKGPGSARMKIG